MKKISDHFARVGGVLISPRATFRRMIETGEGNLLELVPWLILVTVVIAPIETGRAILMLRVDVWEGIMSFVTLLSNRMMPALAGALGAGIVLYLGELIFRPGEEKRGLDLALDATAFTLIPYFFLCVLGVVLGAVGREIWWMPHRQLRGTLPYQLLRLGVSFGWSLVLWGLMAFEFFKPRTRAQA